MRDGLGGEGGWEVGDRGVEGGLSGECERRDSGYRFWGVERVGEMGY